MTSTRAAKLADANPEYAVSLILEKQRNQVSGGLLESKFEGPNGMPHRLPLELASEADNRVIYLVNHEWFVSVAIDGSNARIYRQDYKQLYDCR